jgi:hypothetical protein
MMRAATNLSCEIGTDFCSVFAWYGRHDAVSLSQHQIEFFVSRLAKFDKDQVRRWRA